MQPKVCRIGSAGRPISRLQGPVPAVRDGQKQATAGNPSFSQSHHFSRTNQSLTPDRRSSARRGVMTDETFDTVSGQIPLPSSCCSRISQIDHRPSIDSPNRVSFPRILFWPYSSWFGADGPRQVTRRTRQSTSRYDSGLCLDNNSELGTNLFGMKILLCN